MESRNELTPEQGPDSPTRRLVQRLEARLYPQPPVPPEAPVVSQASEPGKATLPAPLERILQSRFKRQLHAYMESQAPAMAPAALPDLGVPVEPSLERLSAQDVAELLQKLVQQLAQQQIQLLLQQMAQRQAEQQIQELKAQLARATVASPSELAPTAPESRPEEPAPPASAPSELREEPVPQAPPREPEVLAPAPQAPSEPAEAPEDEVTSGQDELAIAVPAAPAWASVMDSSPFEPFEPGSLDRLKDFTSLTARPLQDAAVSDDLPDVTAELESMLTSESAPDDGAGYSMPGEAGGSAILVIEDDPVIGDTLEYLLERENFRVTRANDGREALDLLETIAPPDLVLMDLMLPHLDGFHLIEAIRGRPFWSRVPIVMLSSNAQERDIVRALKAGANDYLTKPFQVRELLARLRRLLKVFP